jgi:hypothetical protein
MPDRTKEYKEKFKKYDEDWVWLAKNFDTLKYEYPNEWVAAFHKEIFDHDENLDVLMKRLEEKFHDDLRLVAVEYVSPEKIEMIL